MRVQKKTTRNVDIIILFSMAFKKAEISMGWRGYSPTVLPSNPLLRLHWVSYLKIVFYYAALDFPSSVRENDRKIIVIFFRKPMSNESAGISSRLRTKRFLRVFSFQFPTHPVYVCLFEFVVRRKNSYEVKVDNRRRSPQRGLVYTH